MKQPLTIETVKTLSVDTRRGQNCELRLTLITDPKSDRPFSVGLFPIGEDTGIAIGVGASRLSALSDALDTLQAARWAIDDALLQIVKDGVGPKRRPYE